MEYIQGTSQMAKSYQDGMSPTRKKTDTFSFLTPLA